MRWTFWFWRILARRFAPWEILDLAMEVWTHVWKRIPPEQRVDFLKSVAEKHLGAFLDDLSRADRIALMNGLLPLAAREFPLSELDFLTVFSSPGDRYCPKDTET